jgi:hypothetical protein
MQVTDGNGYIFGPNGLQINGSDGKPKVISGGGTSSIPFGTASGIDTYSVSITGFSSYNDGDAYLVRFTNGNTTGSTLDVNGLGPVPLYRNNDGELIGGDIEDGAEMLCVYNSSSNIFQVIGTSPNTLLSYVTNDDSVTITKGQPVYASGGQGDRLKVKLAYNTSDATSAQTVGLVLSSSIGVNQKGFIILNGQLDGLSILPTSTWADGDPVYLDATAGSITNIKPHAPNHLVYLGFVTTASSGSAGRMYVRVQNGYEFDELHDVQILSPLNGDLIQYDQSTDLWKNKSLSGAGIQPTLVSGTSIKTVNSTSLLGSGNVAVQPTLVSGTNIKTINGTSVLGAGNITVSGSGSNPQLLGFKGILGTTTSGTAITVCHSLLIPANTLSLNNILQVQFRMFRQGSNLGQLYGRIYFNTTNSLTGATLFNTTFTMNGGGSQYVGLVERNFGYNGTVLSSYSNTAFSDYTTGVATNVSFNYTVDNYILLTMQCQNAGDIANINLYKVFAYV